MTAINDQNLLFINLSLVWCKNFCLRCTETI